MAAYPSVPAPYGLKPINLIGGQVFAGSTRQLAITTSSVNYNTPIFYGDVVTLTADGVVEVSPLAANTSPLAGVVGVFLGCSYTNPATKQKVFQQYWPGYASGVTDAVAFVADDPDQLFKAVNVTGTTSDDATSGLLPAFVGLTAIGNNCRLVLNTGSTTTGDSKTGIYIAGATSSLPFRVVDVVPDTANSSGNFVEFIVKFNFGYHSYYNASGI
jgi:hypothetical protein